MLLRLKRTLTPGSTYFVKLFLDNEVAIVEARVLRLLHADDACEAALQFTSISPDDAACVRAFLKR